MMELYIQEQLRLARANHPPVSSAFEASGLLHLKLDSLEAHMRGSLRRNSSSNRIEQAQTLVHIAVIATRAVQELYPDITPQEITNYYKS